MNLNRFIHVFYLQEADKLVYLQFLETNLKKSTWYPQEKMKKKHAKMQTDDLFHDESYSC
jgi:hypothetical protein